MNYGDIYTNIALRVWGTPTPESSAGTLLKGNEGIIANARRQIQEQNNLWFMEKGGIINVYGKHIKDPSYISISGVDDTHVQCTAFNYRIDGTDYEASADTDIAFSAGYLVQGTATQRSWGAFLYQINAAGTISTKVYDNAQSFTTELEAIKNLPEPDSGNVAFAYLTVAAEIDNWTANTDDLEVGGNAHAANYYSIDRTSYELPARFKEFCKLKTNNKQHGLLWETDDRNYSAPLVQLTTDQIAAFTDPDGYTEYPMYYYMFQRDVGKHITLYPLPNSDKTLRMRYWEFLEDIMPSSEIVEIDDDDIWDKYEDILSIEAPYLLIHKACTQLHGIHQNWEAQMNSTREEAVELSKLLKKNATYWQTNYRVPYNGVK